MYDDFRIALSSFASLTDEEWSSFKETITLRTFAKDDFLLHNGRTCTTITFVRRGALRLYHGSQGKEWNMFFAFEQQFITAYQSFLQQQPTIFDMQALEETEVLLIHYEALQRHYNKYPVFDRIGRLIAENIFIASQQRVANLLLFSPEERYEQLIQQYPQIFERLPLYHIASYLGIERPSLSRIRKRISHL